MENWLLIIVGVIFLICMVIGYIRGFFKIGLSLLSTVLTVVLVMFLSPYVGDALAKYTPMDEMIEERCVEAFMPDISAETFQGVDLSESALSGLSSEELQNLGNLDWDSLGVSAQDILGALGEIPKDQQIAAIESAPFPSFFKEWLLENNNTTIYEELGVTTFPEYVASCLSHLVIRLISFLVTFVLAIIIVKALMVAVDILGELPVVGLLNHCGGAVVGLLTALVVVWLGFLVLTLLYSTQIGTACFEMIGQSQILTFLYEKNILLSRLISFS